MFRKALLATAATLVFVALNSSSAHASSITLTGINGTGVTATVSNYSLTGNVFTFTITNTSTGSTTGTITNIGFALPGTRPNNYTLVSSSNSNYSLAYDLNATSGSQNLVSSFDLVLMDKTNGNPTFGGGSVNNGIKPGQSATFSISGDFSGLTADQIASVIFARFQNVNTGGGSDVAATGGTPTPEPATMFLLGTGLAGLAAKARKRRKTEQV